MHWRTVVKNVNRRTFAKSATGLAMMTAGTGARKPAAQQNNDTNALKNMPLGIIKKRKRS